MTDLTDFHSEGQIGASAFTVAEPGTSEVLLIGQFHFFNTSSSKVNVVVYSLASGGTEDSTSGGNAIHEKTIQPRKYWNVAAELGRLTVKSGYKITATAATADVINVKAGGATES